MKLSNAPMSIGSFLAKGPLPFMAGYAAMVLSPLLLARLIGIEYTPGTREWGTGFGMVALMILLTAFFLSGRFGWVNGKAGLELILKFHRRIVMVALLLAIAHVVMITPYGMPKNFLWVGVPLLLLVVSIALAKTHTKLKLKYEYWRLSHGVVAMIAVAFLCVHAVQDGRYSTHPVLSTYWIVVTMVAILSLFYVHQYIPRKAAKQPYTLVDLQQEANKQWTLTIEAQGFEPMSFKAGQYAFVSFGNTPFEDRAHPFSFVSSPADFPQIAFTIKESGDFTNTVNDLKVGSNVFLYGPYGHLTMDHFHSPQPKERGIVLLASGVGFTPMMSLLRDMNACGETRPIKVFYACQSEADLLYQDELEQMKSVLDLDTHITLTEPPEHWPGECERIDDQYLKKHIDYEGYEQYLYFICGSTPFINSVVKGLEGLDNIPVFNIRFEDFSVYS